MIPFLDKASEGITSQSSSTYLRLVGPYRLLLPYVSGSPLIGLAPGSATDLIARIGVTDLVSPTLIKMTVEYGLLGVTVLLVGMTVAVSNAWRSAPKALICAALAAWLIPGDNLMNGTLVAIVFFALPAWGATGLEPRDRSSRRPQSAAAVRVGLPNNHQDGRENRERAAYRLG